MSISSTELVLLKRVAEQRDPDAFAEIVNRYQNLAFSAAMRVLENEADAQDVTQECFIRLLRRASEVSVSLAGWLHRSATNLALNLIRDRAKRKVHEEAQAALESSLAGKSAWDEVAPNVDAAIDQLPDDLRIPLVEHFFQRRNVIEIAADLDVSAATLYRRIDAAVADLRARLLNRGPVPQSAILIPLLTENAVLCAPPSLTTALTKIALVGFDGVHAGAGAAEAGKSGAGILAKWITSEGAIMKIAAGIIAVAVVAGGVTLAIQQRVSGADAGKSPKVMTGSPDFYPSPERAVGWRGDGTGCYPGATPPKEWGRFPKTGPYANFRFQAAKPKGEDAKDAKALDYFTGSITEWLVLGPFPGKSDSAKNLEEPAIPNESELQGDIGQKVGDAEWKAGVDIGAISAPNQVLYLHVYIHADEAGSVQVIFNHNRMLKAWINGKEFNKHSDWDMSLHCRPGMAVQKGWNRLLCKLTLPEGPKTGNAPSRETQPCLMAMVRPADIMYGTKNVQWMTKLPGIARIDASPSSPVVVGDRIFLQTSHSDLVCISKADGKILWIRSNNYYDALPAEEKNSKQSYKDNVEPLAAKLAAANEEIIKLVNAEVSPEGPSREKRSILCDKMAEKIKLEDGIYAFMRGVDSRKYTPQQPLDNWGVANATPVSDGKNVYIWMVTGVVASYDLNGNRNWINQLEGHLGGTHHGCHSSPALTDTAVLITAGPTDCTLIAFDKKDGKQLWTRKIDNRHSTSYGTTLTRKIGDEWIAIVSDGSTYTVPEGKKLWGQFQAFGGEGPTPVVSGDGMLIHCDRGGFMVGNLPAKVGDASNIPEAKPAPLNAYVIASPLYHDGLGYVVTMEGVLKVYDAKTPALVYEQKPDFNVRRGGNAMPGVCSSPGFAGKYVYIFDNSGYTIVLDPGRKYAPVAKNWLMNVLPGSQSISLETFVACPAFSGKQMFIRGSEYLYCIGDK